MYAMDLFACVTGQQANQWDRVCSKSLGIQKQYDYILFYRKIHTKREIYHIYLGLEF